jgi:5'-methylthioadenosine phosphorylase
METSTLDQEIALAVIGGSGFYEMPGLENVEEVRVETPFGDPSDTFRIGILEGRKVLFLARHGKGHRFLPGEIPQLANFWALKKLGVRRVLGISAVGSLRGFMAPGHMVVPNQIIDRTRRDRPETFFGNGIVAHISLAEPFSAELRGLVCEAASRTGTLMHRKGTYIVIDGPAFGTRAESHLYRTWGADIVGMTALPEAKLAREAEMDYALLTAATDFDSWHSEEAAVDADTVFRVLAENVKNARESVTELVKMLPEDGSGGGNTALDHALVTQMDAIPSEVRERLAPLLERRLGAHA